MKRRYLQHMIHCIAFITVLSLLLLGLSHIMIPKNNAEADGIPDKDAYGILSEAPNTIDVLFLGDSESYSSFVPMQLWEQYGITSYCCGTAGQTLNYTESFLTQCFEKQSPQIVVLETNAIFKKFSADEAILQKVNMRFPVFFYHDRWKSLSLNDFLLKPKYTNINAAKGYYYSNAVDGVVPSDYMKQDDAVEEIPALSREYISSFKTRCQENGAKLILVSTPSTKNWNMAKHNAMEKLAEEMNLEYIDMNLLQKEIPIDWSKDTRDKGDHLNYKGATKVMNYVGDYLNKTGLFVDHREEIAYEEWEYSLVLFKDSVKE